MKTQSMEEKKNFDLQALSEAYDDGFRTGYSQARREEREKDKKIIKKLLDAGEMLWVVVANASGGDWGKQNKEWQEAAGRWRDNYFKIIAQLKLKVKEEK